MGTAAFWAAVVLSGATGLSLGLIGGGGSILIVPVLVYVAGLPVREAIPLSLAVVGATAAAGAVARARNGDVHLQAALLYAGAGIPGAALGSRLTPLVPAPVLMILFAGIMVWVGARMIRTAGEDWEPGRAECRVVKCAAAGFAIGIVTGFLGVGGGFLIVPALLRFARLSMAQAAGTSLVVIAVNSLAGFAAHASDARGGAALALAFTGATLVGLFLGMNLGRRMKPKGLKRAFGGLSLVVALYLIVVNIRPLIGLVMHRG